MRLHTQVLSLILGLVLFSSLVAAANYQVSVTPLNMSTLPNESASFKVVISNFDVQAARFQVYTLDTRWIIRTDPLLYQVEGRSAMESVLYIRPTTAIGYGAQGLTVLIKDIDTNTVNKEALIVYVIDPNRMPGGYAASVNLDVRLPDDINPRDPFAVGINLRNRNGLNISELSIVISSPLFNQTVIEPLAPFAEKTEDEPFTLNPYQAAGDYPLHVGLYWNGNLINEESKTLHIQAITDIQETPADQEELFRHTTTLTLENKGNVT